MTYQEALKICQDNFHLIGKKYRTPSNEYIYIKEIISVISLENDLNSYRPLAYFEFVNPDEEYNIKQVLDIRHINTYTALD